MGSGAGDRGPLGLKGQDMIAPQMPSEVAKAELTGLLYRFPLRILTHPMNAALVVVVLWEQLPVSLLLSWFGLVSAVALSRYLLAKRFERGQSGGRTIETWARLFVLGAAVSGGLWGLTTLVLWLTPDIAYHVFIAFVIAGISAAAVATSYSHPPAVHVFLATSVGPLSLGYLTQGGVLHLAMGSMCLIYLVFLTVHASFSHGVLSDSLRLREENSGLIADLSQARDASERRVKERTGELEAMNATLQLEISAHAETQHRLQQAHRMEAVGQLTGGIAHDFNNLLAIIQGNAELLRASQSNADDQPLASIIRASNRGAELTQRLLAFSRRQPLRPQAILLSDLIAEMTPLLRRTLGATIRIETRADECLWLAQADPGQVENAILNLALNARDAMPDGGSLTITGRNERLGASALSDTLEAAAGDYVMISVKDSGLGMTQEVQDRAFEPFFTTKEVGEGSGLGLSMVYGFAKQSGGHVAIESGTEEGTRVDLYLPRMTPAAETRTLGPDRDEPVPESGQSDREEISEEERPRGRGESILVVEDDSDVRAVAVSALTGLGYRVEAAGNAVQAAARLGSDRFDLLLCDVVLPGGTSGPDFAIEAQGRQPGLKTVFMSGYPRQLKSEGLGTASGNQAVLIRKPFKISYLARTLRDALEAPSTAD